MFETLKNEHEDEQALLIGVYRETADKPTCEEHLSELQRLVETYGARSIENIACPLKKIDASTYLGSGKVDELVERAKELKANLIVFDEEILPSQQRNLEKLFNLPVLDRTEVILDVFAKHAQSNEAKVQVELARVLYQMPRLKRMWTHLSRQRGGGVYQKGEGEKQIELDKRMLRHREARLREELKEVVKHRMVQRTERGRTGIPQVAIIGYTNAGKSTLLNALTEAGVLEEDQLFATLDTTTRKFVLPNDQPILLTDTVGFVRKLPHNLVAAFRSTLEEAVEADLLLHLVDVSHPMFMEQVQATYDLLEELEAKEKPLITVCNKIDLCADMEAFHRLEHMYPKTVAISAKTGEGFDELMQRIVKELSSLRKQMLLKIPQSEYQLIHQLREHGTILSEDYEENDVIVEAEVDRNFAHTFADYEMDEELEDK